MRNLTIDEIPKKQIVSKTELSKFTFPSDLLPIEPPQTFYYIKNFEEALPVFKLGKRSAEESLKVLFVINYCKTV